MLKKTDLNYDWKYQPDFREEYTSTSFDDSSFETVHLPHTNVVLPYNNFDERIYQFESCYRKKLWIESLSPDERVYIRFEGVMTYAKVYLNGHYLGDHKGGYTPFRLDLTDVAVQNSENVLVVYVDSREREDIPPFGFVIDYLTYGGIYREVALEYCRSTHIETIGIRTKDVLSTSPTLNIDLYLQNADGQAKNLTCTCAVKDENGTTIQGFEQEISLTEGADQKISINEVVRDFKLWGLDEPNLYWLHVVLLQDGEIIDRHHVRFGFRDIAFTNNGFYLNGERIKIRGLNRHQSFPYVGYAMPKSAQYKDAEILKYELGVNTVRLSHYPQSNHFLDRCDEIGLLVFAEIPGWQHVGDESWQTIALQNVEEMILKDFNHPSVIIWGVRINESQDHDEFYEKTNELARRLDDSRPTGGVRNLKNSTLWEDIYTYNDFSHTGKNRGLDKKKNVTKTDQPYLVTEYNGHMFPTKKFDNESRRIEHALRHLNVLEAMEQDAEILGAIGWCMFDYNTHKDFGSGDKICYHGVLDMFRIPKYAAFVYGSQQDYTPVLNVASSLNIGEYDGSLLADIYVFTNCDYIKLYKNDEYINTFYPASHKYPSVLHPPIIIDDLIGDAILKNEKFSPTDAKTIKELLIKASKTGANLNLRDTLKMGRLFLKYKMNMRDAEDLYTKYFGGWGGAATTYRFEGYLQDKCVLTTTKSQVVSPKLTMAVDEQNLVEDATYDTTRVVLRLVDDYGNDIIYGNDAVIVETKGPLEVIGPQVLSLIGGSIGFWVKTTGRSGLAKVIVRSERFGVLEETIKVE
jgi:beta-galactosidase